MQIKVSKSTISQFVKKVQAMTDEQKTKILEEDAKISAWLKEHPGEEITADKVGEILKMPVQVPSAKILAYFESPAKTEVPQAKPVEPAPPPAVPKQIHNDMGDFGFKEAKAAIEQEKAASPKTKAPAVPQMPVKPDTEPEAPKTAVPDTELAQHVEEAFKSEIDDFYGKKGLFVHTDGVDTQEWKFMAGLPAAKVMEYYQSDSSNSTLDPETVKELTESSKHQQFLKQMKDLLDQTQGAVKPYASETVEQFFKRLGNFVMRENLSKAAAL